MDSTIQTELRCSHCLLVAEVTGGIADVHDFPYAVDNYGQCKGSGKPVLTGPTIPPAVWGWTPGKTFVDLGVLPSPVPTVTRDGWVVTLSGVRFTHTSHCSKCRTVVYVASDGGTMQLGFSAKGLAFEKEQPGRPALYDGLCPNGCGARVVIGGRYSTSTRATPVAEGHTVQVREWERLRRDLRVWSTNMSVDDVKRLRRAS
jgi:hypothetical protein